MIESKTIARVIGDDSPWIVFTDGTGMRVVGWEDGADYNEVDAEEIAEHEAALAERQRRAEYQAAEYAAWMTRTCEERAEIRNEWLAQRDTNMLIPRDFEDLIMDELLYDFNRTAFGKQPKLKARCPKCNERACPSAPDYVPRPRGVFHKSGEIVIPVKQ